MAKLTRTNFEGFARVMADTMPKGTDLYDLRIPTPKGAQMQQWQKMMHAITAELHDQSGMTPNGNRSFDSARFIARVVKLAGGTVTK